MNYSISNNEYTYEMICSRERAGDKVTTTYGIRIYDRCDRDYDVVEDTSDNYERVKSFCRLLCREGACPVHLKDITEDFLTENYFM